VKRRETEKPFFLRPFKTLRVRNVKKSILFGTKELEKNFKEVFLKFFFNTVKHYFTAIKSFKNYLFK
jgi:hypothetical protein